MREPRGHSEMYGAILVPETELTLAGEADIGVLFCHNGTTPLNLFEVPDGPLNVPYRGILDYVWSCIDCSWEVSCGYKRHPCIPTPEYPFAHDKQRRDYRPPARSLWHR